VCAFRMGIKSAGIGTAMPRSAFTSDLPVGGGARVRMQDARSKAATQSGGRRFSSAAGGNSGCARAMAPKSPPRRKKRPGQPRRTAAAQLAADRQWVRTKTIPTLGFLEATLCHRAGRVGTKTYRLTSFTSFDPGRLAGQCPVTRPRAMEGSARLAWAARRPDQLQINLDLEFSFPVDIDLWLTDCQLIRKGEI
jgi:hypothetical protein